MIGKENLRQVVRDLENRNGTTSCRGELILEIQRALFGSVRISLEPSEIAQVFALIDDRSTQPTQPSPKRRSGGCSNPSKGVTERHAPARRSPLSSGLDSRY